MSTPVWQSDAEALADARPIEYAAHHIVLCDLSTVDATKLESLVPHSRCLSLQAGGHHDIGRRYSEYALACFERIRTILQTGSQANVLVQIVAADHREHAVLAGLSGLLKTAALEHPQLRGQFIITAPDIATEELARRLAGEKTRELNSLVKYEHGARKVLRWQEVQADNENPLFAFKDDGVYLITGGLGRLGSLLAKEILEQSRHAHVVLSGRSAFGADIRGRLDALSPQTGRLSYRQVALEDLDQIARLIGDIQTEHGRLDGIVHVAGMTADNLILKKSAVEFRTVLAPKVVGTFNLDHATRGVHLDFFVLFSSVASALGHPGQADYAAANGFMDHFAAFRNRLVAAMQRYGRTRSINWPLWQEGGMRLDRATLEVLQQASGVQPLQTAAALRAFHRSLALPCDQTLVVHGARERITTYLQGVGIFEPPYKANTAAGRPYAQDDMAAAISLDQLQQQFQGLLATVLRVDPSVIDIDQPFVEVGLDSFLGAELIVAINKRYGTALSHLRLFDYTTVKEFSLFLEQEIRKLPAHAKKPEPADRRSVPIGGSVPAIGKPVRAESRTAARNAPSADKVAIIGMSGRYPGARNVTEYWRNLAEGRNAIVEVPASRWDVNRYYDPERVKKDKTYSKWLGALDDVDCFDPLFFRISPQEAAYVDPQHRLFLQESYRAFEDAGYSTGTLSSKKCGVYLGISTNDYMSLLLRQGVLSAPVTSNSYAIAAARIAYYLNLTGPAMSVDTACSSSLVAVHLACQAILSGEIDMALAGGVSLWLSPESYVAMSQAGMFSASGQCKTFDDGADGIVNGDGVGAVVLKRLTEAQADGDVIYGVILGSGINQDGRTNGITAPSVRSQIELERSIYATYDIDPGTISYVETHGTGTRLGDPIELEALATVFKERTSQKQFCALGSVKSNIGHTTSAAGVAGLQKVLLSMRHRTLVPSLNVTKENSRFDFENSPFYISRETKAWEAVPGSPRRAAVSSFGFSGTNAHLVVEEYVSPPEQAVPVSGNTPLVVLLSARTPEQLQQRARDLVAFVRSAQPLDLAAVAYTLQIGREPMEERLALLVTSEDQLVAKLSTYLDGESNVEGMYQGRAEIGNEAISIIGADDDMQEAVDRWIARRKLSKLLDLWSRGLNIDWHTLYDDGRPRRVSLPTYPFASERYWIDEAAGSRRLESQIERDGHLKSLEDIINKIDDDAIESDEAVKLLRVLV